MTSKAGTTRRSWSWYPAASAIPTSLACLRPLQRMRRCVTRQCRYVVEFVDYSEKQTTDKEHVRVPKSEQVRDVAMHRIMRRCRAGQCDRVIFSCAQEFIGVFEKKSGQKHESKHRDERGDDHRGDRRDGHRGDRRDDYRNDRRDDYRDGRGSGGGRGRSASPSRDQKSIEEQIREREREKALAVRTC